ncbi:hypothetical protein LCGC14_2005400 [marine sediment metagenome]|uniref:Uncharacterized protein n=1 Tax=marine sediment metagenome TaxID=412755 RepID=A0A0F9HYZ5_9ZZZZ
MLVEEKDLIGPISSDTMNPLHLIPIFAVFYTKVTGKELAAKLYHLDETDLLTEEELAGEIDDLYDLLNEIAPPYSYFGANEDDGACFGFWPLIDSIQDDVRNEELLTKDKVDIGQEAVRTGQYVADINERGNVTLYRVKEIVLEEIWSIV